MQDGNALRPDTGRNTVGVLCRRRSVKQRRARFLLEAVRTLKPTTVLELGTGLGISTAYLCAGLHINGRGMLTTVEGCPNLAELARRNLYILGLRRFTVLQGVFAEVLDRNEWLLRSLDLIFIDGHHVGSALESYFTKLVNLCKPVAVFILDDIEWSEDMRLAWSRIIRSAPVAQAIERDGLGVILKG